jgi:hypothetical protein
VQVVEKIAPIRGKQIWLVLQGVELPIDVLDGYLRFSLVSRLLNTAFPYLLREGGQHMTPPKKVSLTPPPVIKFTYEQSQTHEPHELVFLRLPEFLQVLYPNLRVPVAHRFYSKHINTNSKFPKGIAGSNKYGDVKFKIYNLPGMTSLPSITTPRSIYFGLVNGPLYVLLVLCAVQALGSTTFGRC